MSFFLIFIESCGCWGFCVEVVFDKMLGEEEFFLEICVFFLFGGVIFWLFCVLNFWRNGFMVVGDFIVVECFWEWEGFIEFFIKIIFLICFEIVFYFVKDFMLLLELFFLCFLLFFVCVFVWLFWCFEWFCLIVVLLFLEFFLFLNFMVFFMIVVLFDLFFWLYCIFVSLVVFEWEFFK